MLIHMTSCWWIDILPRRIFEAFCEEQSEEQKAEAPRRCCPSKDAACDTAAAPAFCSSASLLWPCRMLLETPPTACLFPFLFRAFESLLSSLHLQSTLLPHPPSLAIGVVHLPCCHTAYSFHTTTDLTPRYREQHIYSASTARANTATDQTITQGHRPTYLSAVQSTRPS